MAAITEEQVEQIRTLVSAIPAGRVSTYGDLAAAAGLSSPRIVGWIMRTDTADLPWHRVVPASGRPAPHLAHRQLERLRAEGVPITDGRIRLRECRWDISV
ncbi:putative methylated DNA-protein cysteine methyltransferase [Gordonia terrae C-6]|uniref:Putative methylated DNA-protein cysteine methyltransferase n=1 Tax=Gordonia terrae C-6 TaxID=1316928 RepID=R7Y5U4_9ACTN|nr:MGMT family protein [Gordonia terrae]EON31433.1 putative methylated DNA-protein cysteine methyltransferase [Gordonia terrae C-6]